MASHEEIVDRFLEQAFEEKPRFLGKLKPGGNPVGIRSGVFKHGGSEFHGLFSYGDPRQSFPILIAIPDRKLFVLNGDGAGLSEPHQAFVRTAIQGPSSRWHRTAQTPPKRVVPHIILPFSALDPAEIHYATIEPIEVLADRWVPEARSASNWDDVPWESRFTVVQNHHEPLKRVPGSSYNGNCPTCGNWSCNGTMQVKVERGEDGLYHWDQEVHFLGASVFRARYGEQNETATFLSAFDAAEARPLYFLAQLPKEVESYDDALEALKPMEVKKAEANEVPVLRQGDMFFIRTELSTDWLRKHGKMTLRATRMIEMDRDDGTSFTKRLEEANRIWATAHTASALVELPSGELYARGQIRHRPEGRMRDHSDILIGAAWHQVVRNTVPLQNVPGVIAPRAWSLSGRVD